MDEETDFYPFGDGRYRFHFSTKLLLQLERDCGSIDREGIAHPKSYQTIMDQMGEALGHDQLGELAYVQSAGATFKDTRVAARLALAGGGSGLVDGESVTVTDADAVRLVDDYVSPDSEQGLIVAQFAIYKALRRATVGIQTKKKAPTPVSEENLNPSSEV